MRCLVIVADHPISPHGLGGGSAVFFDIITALHGLGHEVHLWHYAFPLSRERFNCFVGGQPETWAEVQSLCHTVTLTTFSGWTPIWWRIFDRGCRVLRPDRSRRPYSVLTGKRCLSGLIAAVRPHFIWATHYSPGRFALAQRQVPVVYSHHDWLHKLRLLRGEPASPHLRAEEERLARAAAVVTSGSTVECEELRAIGCQRVYYLPVSCSSSHWNDAVAAGDDCRVVHLGYLETTANKLGLARFFDVVWPRLSIPPETFWVIGHLGSPAPQLVEHLRKITCTGYVPELASVLRPFDLHLIPWEHSTGLRTRVPLAFRHGQVVVAVRASVAGTPEACHQRNCWLVERLEEMPEVINTLLRDPATRERLGRAARLTFERSFTRAAVLPIHRSVIAAVEDTL